MDALLVIGQGDSKLEALFKKMGYDVSIFDGKGSLSQLMHATVFDAIIIDGRFDDPAHPIPYVEFIEYLSLEETSRKVPVTFIAANAVQSAEVSGMRRDGLEVVGSPVAYGALMTKIATALRLRKMAGADDRSATLSEANAALRDLNRRFIQEREEAREIQQSLLPRNLPADPRFEIAVSYEPLEEVGGDWYYINQTSEGRLSLLIADVTGHGLSAALIGSMTKLAISAANTEMPHELLGAVNRLLSPQMPEGRFVTMGSFLFDPSNGQLHFARAGHPPGMLLSRKEKVVHQLKGNGFAVGFMEDGEYSAEKAVLQPGDVLLLVTDGLLEAENRARDNYGLERLQKVLLATKPENSAVEILEQVIESFETFRDGRILKDDVSLVLLKRAEKAQA